MKSRTTSAVAKDRRKIAKTYGGPQADTELQSAIFSMPPPPPCPVKEVSYKDYEINKILYLFFRQYQDKVSYT